MQKRAPALLDNLSQALLMAPFFVLLEVISEQIFRLFVYFFSCWVTKYRYIATVGFCRLYKPFLVTNHTQGSTLQFKQW